MECKNTSSQLKLILQCVWVQAILKVDREKQVSSIESEERKISLKNQWSLHMIASWSKPRELPHQEDFYIHIQEDHRLQSHRHQSLKYHSQKAKATIIIQCSNHIQKQSLITVNSAADLILQLTRSQSITNLMVDQQWITLTQTLAKDTIMEGYRTCKWDLLMSLKMRCLQ